MKQDSPEQAALWPLTHGAIRQVQASPDGNGLKMGVVVSRFNQQLTYNLVNACTKAMVHQGVSESNIDVYWVPGAYEIPFMIKKLAKTHRFDVIVALGCVVQGETPHADLINQAVAGSLVGIAVEENVPVINEVVGVYKMEHAQARCTDDEKGRGWYAGCAAVEMGALAKAVQA